MFEAQPRGFAFKLRNPQAGALQLLRQTPQPVDGVFFHAALAFHRSVARRLCRELLASPRLSFRPGHAATPLCRSASPTIAFSACTSGLIESASASVSR